jgi:hypothetical protein
VRAAEAHFGHVPREGAPGALRGRAVSPNIGGDARSSPDWAAVPATAAGAQAASKTEFTHVMLALPTVGWSHDDVVPVCVVDTLQPGTTWQLVAHAADVGVILGMECGMRVDWAVLAREDQPFVIPDVIGDICSPGFPRSRE